MAERALCGALRRRDGRTERFTARAEPDLRSLRAAVHTLSSALSRALTALVEEEQQLSGRDARGQEESDEEHSAEEEEEESVRSRPGRPNKRRRH